MAYDEASGQIVMFGGAANSGPRTDTKRCGARRVYRHLRWGRHVFRVYAVDSKGRRSKARVVRFVVRAHRHASRSSRGHAG